MRIGVDIEKIARFKALLLKESFKKGVFTEKELSYIGESAARAAGLWCAKEACAKALGDGLYGLLPKDIEITHDEKGAPHISLHGGALKKYPDVSFSLSITHDEDTAFAAVCDQGEALDTISP